MTGWSDNEAGWAAQDQATDKTGRTAVLTPASSVKMKRVRWLWEGRIALGALSLIAGREGKGKSTIAYWLAARVTRGELPGEYHGTPRAVFVCATEDSWESTIAPRLWAAGADMDLIFRLDIAEHDEEGSHITYLTLPKDNQAVTDAAIEYSAALLLLDPLMSRLDAKLDSHKDAEVRLALEPLVKMAETARLAVVGLIHLNKSNTADPLNAVMASRAFSAVARSVSVAVDDPEDDTKRRRLFGTPKNNLGRDDLPLMPYTIEGAPIESDDGTIWTGRVEWQDEVEGTIQGAMERAVEGEDVRSATDEAGDWLEDWLGDQGGEAKSADAKKAGQIAGHSQDALKRAVRRRKTLAYRSEGCPRYTVWYLALDNAPPPA